MVRGEVVPLIRAAFNDDRFIIELSENSIGKPGGNGDTRFILSNPDFRAEVEAAAAAENRTIDDPRFMSHLTTSFSRWKMEAINDASRPALAKYRKPPRRRRQTAGGALGQPVGIGNNAASAAAAAFPSNVLSHGHVGMVPSQHPMGVAMSYEQQQALLAAQLQQQRQMLNGSIPEYAGSAAAGADGMAQYANAAADGGGSGGGGGAQDPIHQPDAHVSGTKGPDKPSSGGEDADDDDDDDDEGRGQGGGAMVVAAKGKGKGAARGGNGGVNDITAGIGNVAIGGGRGVTFLAAPSAQPTMLGGLHQVAGFTSFLMGQQAAGMQLQLAQYDERQREAKAREREARDRRDAEAENKKLKEEVHARQLKEANEARERAEEEAANEKERRIVAEQEKKEARAAAEQEKKKDAAAKQNQLDKIEKGMEEGFTELKRGLKGMNDTLNTPIAARAGFAHDREFYNEVEDLAGNNVPFSPQRQPSFGSGDGHPDAHEYDTAFGVGNDQYDTGFGAGISDGKQPSTDDDLGLDGDMANLFDVVDESESKIAPTIQGPDIEKEEAEEKKDDDSGDEEGGLGVKETTIAPVQRGMGKDFSMMVQNREEKQRAKEEREEEEELKRKEDAHQRKITRDVQAEANLASRKTVIPTIAVEPLNKRLLAIEDYDENKVQEELLAREAEEAEEEAKKSKKKSKAKSKQKKGKGKKKDLGSRPDSPLVKITERFDEDSKKNKSRWHRNGKFFAGKILEVTSVKSAAHCTRKLRSNNSSTGWIVFCKYDGGGNDRVVLYDPAHFELVNVAVESEE